MSYIGSGIAMSGKIKLKDPEVEKWIHKHIFRSVRSHTLQKLMLLWFNVWFSRKMPLYKKLEERLRNEGLPFNRINVVEALTLEDIMSVLNCSQRTAFDYKQTLRFLMT